MQDLLKLRTKVEEMNVFDCARRNSGLIKCTSLYIISSVFRCVNDDLPNICDERTLDQTGLKGIVQAVLCLSMPD